MNNDQNPAFADSVRNKVVSLSEPGPTDQTNRIASNTKRTIRLVTEHCDYRPALDTAISRAILQRVSEGSEPETLRLFRPAPVVAFGPQDTRSPGYGEAVRLSRENGFEAINRLAGGRAAVFHEGTLGFAWAIPDNDPRQRVDQRFNEIADIMVKAFKSLGIDARVGEVPGEYCPGRHSVNARGEKKLMGVGQRTILRGAHVGGVIVVNDGNRVRDILVPVYDALGLEWNPETTGSIEDEVGPTQYDAVSRAVIDEFAIRYDLVDGVISSETLPLAESFEAEHLAP